MLYWISFLVQIVCWNKNMCDWIKFLSHSLHFFIECAQFSFNATKSNNFWHQIRAIYLFACIPVSFMSRDRITGIVTILWWCRSEVTKMLSRNIWAHTSQNMPRILALNSTSNGLEDFEKKRQNQFFWFVVKKPETKEILGPFFRGAIGGQF